MRWRYSCWLLLSAALAVQASPECPSGETWCRGIELGPGAGTGYLTGDAALDRLQEFFAPALAANRKEFPAQSGLVRGFGAGSGYAQIWLRDSATMIPALRYLYPREYLTSWVEEHLLYQAPDGQLLDWFANMPRSKFQGIRVHEVFRRTAEDGQTIVISGNKNTIESDQEASAVNAVYEICRVTGDYPWLRKSIAGEEIITRLDRSLRFLLENRLSRRYGLITSGMAADWGDVGPVYEDVRRVHVDDRTPLVAGIYTNAMFYSAATKLAELYRRLGDRGRASYWTSQARRIRQAMNRHLWMPNRGYYRVHRVADPQKAEARLTTFDNSHIFAMGGNAVCVLYGIADRKQAARIFEVARRRYQELGAGTVSASLLPPFPEGFFRVATLSPAFSYQNGGQWDWFGGRLVLAEFQQGFEELAYGHLLEIARKSVACGGLYEWHTPDGKCQGSSNYAGSAGVLAAAVFEGLFGIELGNNHLDLRIRLGERPGAVHVHQPVTGEYAAYHYHPDLARHTARLWFDSNVHGPGTVSIRIPPGRKIEHMELDSKPVRFRASAAGPSRFVTISTVWGPHAVVIHFR